MGAIIGDILAAIIKIFFGIFVKSPQEKLGIAETQNEIAQKTVEIQKAQLDIANGAPDSDSNVVHWLRDDSK